MRQDRGCSRRGRELCDTGSARVESRDVAGTSLRAAGRQQVEHQVEISCQVQAQEAGKYRQRKQLLQKAKGRRR